MALRGTAYTAFRLPLSKALGVVESLSAVASDNIYIRVLVIAIIGSANLYAIFCALRMFCEVGQEYWSKLFWLGPLLLLWPGALSAAGRLYALKFVVSFGVVMAFWYTIGAFDGLEDIDPKDFPAWSK